MTAIQSDRLKTLLDRTVLWDNHACMPLRPEDDSFLPQLSRFREAGVSLVSLNIYFDMYPPEVAFGMLASFRRWLSRCPADYILAERATDIELAKKDGKLAIIFDIEGGRAVESHPGLIEIFYRLGVRWMLLAYNKNNRLGGGCQDDDCGLTSYGRTIIDEMERVGMVLCCSHTGYRTARDAMEYSRKPVIFSHSNPRAVKDHPRNIPDDLIVACAKTGGVVNINGFGTFLGDNDNSTETLLTHIDYVANLVGSEHVGLGLDYVFDREELDSFNTSRPDLYPPEKGYRPGTEMVEPERYPVIAEALLARGYTDAETQGILGHNNLRIARSVWT